MTHIWIWWVNADVDKLKPRQRELIGSIPTAGVSAISCFEVAWLHRHSRISISIPRQQWFTFALDNAQISLLPITPEIASLAVELPEHHTDPQDRIIIATAIAHNAMLLSCDEKFKQYRELDNLLV